MSFVWYSQASTGIFRGASRSLHSAISIRRQPRSGSSCRSMRSTTLSLSGISVVADVGEVGDRDPLGDLDRGPLVPADPRLVPSGAGTDSYTPHDAVTVNDSRSSGIWQRSPIDAGIIRPRCCGVVLQAGVLVGPGAAVVNRGERDAPALLGVVRVPDVGIGLAGVRVRRIAGAGGRA